MAKGFNSWNFFPNSGAGFRQLADSDSRPVTGVEVLALASANEFVDPLFGKLHDEFALGRHHGKESCHSASEQRAEALPVLLIDVSVLCEGFHDGHKSRIDFGCISFFCGHGFNSIVDR